MTTVTAASHTQDRTVSFRLVTADVTAERFGVSTQQMNARFRRLAHHGLITRHQPVVNQGATWHLTGYGSALLGHRRRRPAAAA